MSIETQLLASIVGSACHDIIKTGVAGAVQTRKGNVGTLSFGGSKADVELLLHSGQPYDLDKYEQEIIEIDNYRFKLYMKIAGTWVKKISGRGVIVMVEGMLDGPRCSDCGEKDKWTEVDGFWGKKIMCQSCGSKHAKVRPDVMVRKVTNSMRKLMFSSLGLK